jgi:hypothetical protein
VKVSNPNLRKCFTALGCAAGLLVSATAKSQESERVEIQVRPDILETTHGVFPQVSQSADLAALNSLPLDFGRVLFNPGDLPLLTSTGPNVHPTGMTPDSQGALCVVEQVWNVLGPEKQAGAYAIGSDLIALTPNWGQGGQLLPTTGMSPELHVNGFVQFDALLWFGPRPIRSAGR